MGRKTKAHIGIALLCAFGVVLATVAPASAAVVNTHPFVSSLTPPASATPNGFSPGGIAVDQSNGKVYVADVASDAVDIFSAAGAYLGQLDDSNTPFPFVFRSASGIPDVVADIAVDNSGGPGNGRVYVTAQGMSSSDSQNPYGAPSGIYSFSADGTYLPSFYNVTYPYAVNHLEQPCALAVDSHGNVALSYISSPRVTVLNSSGAKLSQIDTSGFLGFREPDAPAQICGLAYDSLDGLYVRAWGTHLVGRFDPAGQFERLVGTAQGAFAAFAVEVDRSTDDLYVDDDQGNVVSQYDASGTLLDQFGLTKFNNSAGISLNESSGRVYVADSQHSRVAVFGPEAAVVVPDVMAKAPDEITDTTATFSGTINPRSLDTLWRFQFKRHKTKNWTAYAPAACIADPEKPGQFTDPLCDSTCPAGRIDPTNDHRGFCISPTGNADAAVSTPVTGLAQNTTYDVRIQAVDTATGAAAHSNVVSFTTDGLPQAELTIDPASMSPHSVRLSGTVNPNGSAATWRFQYTTDDTFEEDWKDSGPEQSLPSGSSPVAVSTDLGGLVPNTHYFARLIGTSDGGAKASEEIEFTTASVLPLIRRTLPAGVPTETSVTLGATINPQNSPTTYWFEYGPTDSYGVSFPATEDASAGSGFNDLLVRQDLSGLEAATEYHFRIAAHNPAGTVYGKDMTFETVDPAKGPPQRGIELVSNPDKGNQNSIFPALSPNGNRVLWNTLAGAPGSPSGAVSDFLAERTGSGWQSRSLLPELGEGLLGDSSYAYYVQRYNTDFTGFVAFAIRGFISTRGSDQILVRLDDKRHQEVLHVFPPEVGLLSGEAAGKGGFDTSADLSHVFAGTNERIVAAHAPKTFNIYDFGSGSPVLVSRLPNGAVPSCGVARPFYFSNVPSNPTNSPEGEAPEWISTDGSRVFFLSSGTGACGSPPQLYVRDLETSTTTLISGPGVPGATELIRAAPDGRSAIFTTATSLVGADTDGSDDVYLWSEGQITACLTCGATPAAVTDAIASRDLSRVYFNSKSQLIPGEGEGGELSLYVWRGGELDYVAPSGSLSPSFVMGTRARLSADGNVLLFAGAEGASADRFDGLQLYRYEDSSQRLLCVSCRAQGETAGGPIGGDAIRAQMSADGETVAFVTGEPLFRADVNQAGDIYEWRSGRLALLTGGEQQTSGDNLTGATSLDGITPDGSDILFSSSAKLAPGVLDPYSQVYDARAGGGFPAPPAPPARCEGDACQGPLSPVPGLAQPGSSSFEGPANQAVRAKTKAKHRTRKRHQHEKKRHSAKREGRKHG